MSEIGTFTVEDGIGITTIDSPPVNTLSVGVRRAIMDGLRGF